MLRMVYPFLILQILPLAEPFEERTEVALRLECAVVSIDLVKPMLAFDTYGDVENSPINRVERNDRKRGLRVARQPFTIGLS